MANQKLTPKKRTFLLWALPIAAVLSIKLLALFPEFVETWYAQNIYPPVGRFFRLLFGWLPFSVGDALIGIAIFYVLFKLIKYIQRRKTSNSIKPYLLQLVSRIFRMGMWLYVLFHVVWGLNYYRQGSAQLLHITPAEYATQDVDTLLQVLTQRLNTLSNDSLTIRRQLTADRELLTKMASTAYTQAATTYVWMKPGPVSVKPNLLGSWQSYTGYGGYLFPFTGEAQVDFNAPAFTLPFTVCHEMAHQIGFGSESEANLIGYLAGRASENVLLQYSTYIEMHAYSAGELWGRDSLLAKQRLQTAPYMVKLHRKELRDWALQHRNPLQPILHWIYEKYLFNTNQPLGLQSYNRVVAWLIAYGKKYGWHQL